MEVQQLSEGVWRWTAPHPDWTPAKARPGGWWQMVGSVLYAPPEDEEAVVLIDPLAPPEGTEDAERFWTALDRDLGQRLLPVAIFISCEWHARSAQAVFDRYSGKHGASIHAARVLKDLPGCRVTDTFQGDVRLPGGVLAFPLPSFERGEVAFYLPSSRALVFGDAVIGTGPGRVQVAPESWATDTPTGRERYRGEFRTALKRLLDQPVEAILVSHGDPVLEDGARALREALEGPAWGD